MRNITMTCPQCKTADRAVGDPKEADQGATGKWHCFACGASGTYGVALVTVTGSQHPVE